LHRPPDLQEIRVAVRSDRRWLRGDVVGRRRIVADRLIRLEGERVAWMGTPAEDPAGARAAELVDGVLAPAYVDVHCHGGGGIDVHGPGIDALAGGGPAVIAETVDALRAFAAFEASRGVAAVLPTAVTIPIPALRTWVRAVGEAVEGQRRDIVAGRTLLEARILGANLEGPALSEPRRGAHDPAMLVPPQALLDAFIDTPAEWRPVRIVTVAPEGPGGLELVRMLTGRGIIVSLGHTTADTALALEAYEAGARSTTHLFNAMASLHHREPGPVGVVLGHPTAHAEIIADGIHVHPMLLPPIARALGDRLLYVSDGIPAAGMGDGELRVGTLHVTVRGPEARLDDGTLAGSVTPLDGGVEQAVRSGVPLPAAVAAASLVPARLIGAGGRGAIRRGARADFVVLSPQGQRMQTILGGRDLA
jgi:N-acetylglucosamine-6-phosphate deacetylase